MPAAKASRRATFPYDPELARTICERVANGQLVKSILTEEGMPNRETFRKWRHENNELAVLYARAQAEQMHTWSEDIITLADDSSGDWVDVIDGKGNTKRVFQRDHVDRVRLQIDTRKFLMAKLNRDTYGDKASIDVNHGLQSKDDAELWADLQRFVEALGMALPPHLLDQLPKPAE